MSPRLLRRRHRGAAITVSYDIARCIHAEECTRGLPPVFDRGRDNWIDPDGDAAERTAQVVFRCPSGALRAESPQGAELESTPAANQVQLSRDGPLYVRGELLIATIDGEQLHADTRLALCRCGASANKPFCDNSHLRIGFASGTPKRGAQQTTASGGRLTIVPKRNGPFELEGGVEIVGESGETIFRGTSTRLCRCGASNEKPFCDDSHHEFDFEAEVW